MDTSDALRAMGGEVETSEEALRAMEEANHIIEDFSVGHYALYLFIFLVQIALFFWIGVIM